tara:strand:+ start:21712 stop:22434 length:723 start_codon:yes stop_codon:yes gene_type:complete
MVNKRFKPLNANELTVLQHSLEGESDVISYQKGYPHVARYKPATIIEKTEKFFNSERMKYFISTDLPNRNDVAILEGRGVKGSYYPELVQECIDWFNVPPINVEVTVDEHTGETSFKSTVNNLPTRAGFAVSVGILQSTLADYAIKLNKDGTLKYPDFALAWRMARDAQENILVQNTLSGAYNAGFAKFVAQNLLDYRESRDLTVVDNSPKVIVQINNDMTPEQAAQVYIDQMKGLPDKS